MEEGRLVSKSLVNTNTKKKERLPTTQREAFVANDNDEAEELARFGATLDGASVADGLEK